jgi:hypothetical protein
MAKRNEPNGRNPTPNELAKMDNAAEHQRSERRRNRGNGENADWSSADAATVLHAIQAVTQHGFAIRFGYTRDMGAFAVGIIGDGEPFTEFVRPTEDINYYLTGVGEDYAK